MPDIHLPQFDDHEEEDAPTARESAHRPRTGSLFKIALEVALIGAGVFLGLAGEQWRENARHRELAEASLRRFRMEISTNRKSVAGVQGYHAALNKNLDLWVAADPNTRKTIKVQLQGLQRALFEHTAWDLALATQSLEYIDPSLAFSLSRIYAGSQQEYSELTRDICRPCTCEPRPRTGMHSFQR
jgi:hypothetical protein